MATFRVGQRVKKVRHYDGRSYVPIGTIGTILLHDGKPAREGRVMFDYDVAYDGIAERCSAMSWQIEPLYDGHQTVNWDALKDLWQPTSESETA